MLLWSWNDSLFSDKLMETFPAIGFYSEYRSALFPPRQLTFYFYSWALQREEVPELLFIAEPSTSSGRTTWFRFALMFLVVFPFVFFERSVFGPKRDDPIDPPPILLPTHTRKRKRGPVCVILFFCVGFSRRVSQLHIIVVSVYTYNSYILVLLEMTLCTLCEYKNILWKSLVLP